MSEPLLSISNLTLEFDIYGKDRGFRSRVSSMLGLSANSRPRRFKALDDVSMALHRGERLAIMGHNGAGKSSLLKVIAGVYPVEQGRVELRGSIAPLIELGAGFNPHLSARKNIILNGAMFGYTRREMLDKTPEILEFAGLTEFADVPLRNYSTGMRRRLAFTIATDMRPDLLIIDEIFAGGDLQFVGRARARMHDLMGRANALLMVSHNLRLLEQFCERGMWIDRGKLRAEGPVKEVTAAYRASVAQPVVMNEHDSSGAANEVTPDEYLTDEPDLDEDPFVIDPGNALHVRFPPDCWERVSRCHCQGALQPGPHPGWQICRRCRTWVNANRLRHDVARRLAEREPLPVGVYPPGLARLSERADELDLTPLVRAVHGERGDGMAGAAVVHLGCATGHLLETLRGEGAAVEGLERNPALAAAARERLGEVVRPGGPEELTPASADVLLCIDCLGRTHDPAAALARMKQALRPEGRLVLCEPIFDDPAAPLNFPAALLARVMYNYHFSRGGIETLSHVAQFVNIRDHGSWNDWPILILK